MQLCTEFLLLLLVWTVTTDSCSTPTAKFYAITGVDCVGSNFFKIESGLCTVFHCSIYCANTEMCKAFTIMTNDTCQCKLFLFDACSHRVQSVPNCTNQVTVYVRSLPGVPHGRLCPPEFGLTKYGTSYKVTSTTLSWSAANLACNALPGLSKFADAIDQEEAEYLRFLSQPAASSIEYFIGGYLKSGQAATSYSSWLWAACNLPIAARVWHSGEPNGGTQTGCTNLNIAYSSGGINDAGCFSEQRYVCECQSVF